MLMNFLLQVKSRFRRLVFNSLKMAEDDSRVKPLSEGRENGCQMSLADHANQKKKKQWDTSVRLWKEYKCAHYKRNCEFFTPCCNRTFRCRFCHDETQDHLLAGDIVSEIVCSSCKTKQPVQQNCQNCNLRFAKYFCKECKLFDNEEGKKQFHCDGCRICRLGGKDKFFHCEGCNMCLPVSIRGKHRCIENLSHTDCPVCLEDIHTSREASQIPPCHHLIHKSCYNQLIRRKIYNCPTCGKSLLDMSGTWKYYDSVISTMQMPDDYKDVYVRVYCKDCEKKCMTRYHMFALKCTECGSYNTARDHGPLYRKTDDATWVEFDIFESDRAREALITFSESRQRRLDSSSPTSSESSSSSASQEDGYHTSVTDSSFISDDSFSQTSSPSETPSPTSEVDGEDDSGVSSPPENEDSDANNEAIMNVEDRERVTTFEAQEDRARKCG